jgi:hypothetical protein
VQFSFPYGHSHLFITSGVVSLEIRAFQSTLFIASCCVCCHVGSIVNCFSIVSEAVVTNARSTEFPFTFSDFTFDTVHVSAMCLIWSSNSVEAKSRWITVGKVFGTYESVRIFVGANYLVKGTVFLLSSSSSSALCRVFILIFLRQTMSLGNTVLQPFCCSYSWCIHH